MFKKKQESDTDSDLLNVFFSLAIRTGHNFRKIHQVGRLANTGFDVMNVKKKLYLGSLKS